MNGPLARALQKGALTQLDECKQGRFAMKTFTMISLMIAGVLAPVLAHAEAEAPAREAEGVAPSDAFEITIAQGISQGFGTGAQEGVSMRDLGGLGPSLQLGLGYRIDPRFMVGVYVEGARYSGSSAMPDGTDSFSAAFGVQGQYHFRPFSKIDPWIGAGIGYRSYWVDRPNTSHETLQGLEVLRLRVGADYRISPSTSIGPVVGGTLSVFTTTEPVGEATSQSIDDPGVSGFLFVGLQGRFDIGGERVEKPRARVASR